jgi:hypothetical protein
MNALQDIINIMSPDDKQAFTYYLNKKNKRKDVVNTSLFKVFETDDINQQNLLLKKIKSPDAYHALRKRLYDSLIEFTGRRKFETDTSAEHNVLCLVITSRTFFEHKLYKEAFKCLAKAETKAIGLEHFVLLNEIYHTHLQFAQYDTDDLDKLIEKFNANRENMVKEEQMNIAYALLRRELADIYHKGKVIDFTAFIKQTMEQHGVSPDALTFKSLYQILFIANEYASLNSNYKLVEPFMENAYKFIIQKETLTDRYLYYHIYILYLLANMHFRNRRFSESKSFLQKMEEQMQKQGSRYYSRFCMRYYLLHTLNENYSGNIGTAISIAEKALKKYKDADPADIADLRLALLVFYLQYGDRTVFKLLNEFNHTDSWYEKKMGMDWAIKKKLVEVLLHMQYENTELALSALKSFKRRYKKYIIDVKEERVLNYAAIIETLINKPEIIKTPAFKEKLEQFVTSSGADSDIFAVSFIGWLKARVEKKPVYDTILNLIQPS